MRMLFAFLFALILPMAAYAGDAKTDATAAAKAWLALVDAGNFSQSWKDASTLLQARVTADEWEKSAKPIHETLGDVVSRELSGVDLMDTLPGAPDGKYAIIHYKTKFAQKAGAVETVTMFQEGTAWKAAGYFIK
jgi:hypothetical protein